MSYIRVDHKGEMRFVTDDSLLQSIAEDQGQILVVTGASLRSNELWESLVDLVDAQKQSKADCRIQTQYSTIRIRPGFDYRDYLGLQLSSAYVHIDATLHFLIRVMSRCRLQPKDVGPVVLSVCNT